jgi:hypothetical protein
MLPAEKLNKMKRIRSRVFSLRDIARIPNRESTLTAATLTTA